MMNLTHMQQKVSRVLLGLFMAILVLVPFQGFLTTWVSTFGGDLLIWRAWKELLLVPAVLLAFWLLWQLKPLRKQLFTRRINQVIVVFALWQLLVAALLGRDVDATALGLVIQLRLFVIFLLAQIIVYIQPVSKQLIRRLVLIPAALVVGFGLLQMFVLPHDFLTHFGYEKNVTIPPYFTIDEQLDKLRIASTLRGPNTLGAYLVLPGLLLLSSCYWWLRHIKGRVTQKNIVRALPHFLLLGGLLVVLYGSHSRSAWLGFLLAATVWVLLNLPRTWQKNLIIIGLICSVLLGATIYQYRDTGFVQDVILHDNPQEGGEVSSNQGHLEATLDGIKDVQKDPVFGCAPGCAGPASVHNEDGTRISENYYVQTAQESGLIGLLLLLTIFALVGWQLFRSKPDPLTCAWLAAFIGIALINMLVHAWADDTLAYLWWGAAGLILWPVKNHSVSGQSFKNRLTSAVKKS